MTTHSTSPTAPDATVVTVVDIDRTVNDTVLLAPDTLRVFAEYGLDTCCRGAMTIRNAAAHEQIAIEQLVTDLHAVLQPSEG